MTYLKDTDIHTWNHAHKVSFENFIPKQKLTTLRWYKQLKWFTYILYAYSASFQHLCVCGFFFLVLSSFSVARQWFLFLRHVQRLTVITVETQRIGFALTKASATYRLYNINTHTHETKSIVSHACFQQKSDNKITKELFKLQWKATKKKTGMSNEWIK